jgi:hypothetical protein
MIGRRWMRALLRLALLAVVLLAVLELGARGFLWMRGQPYDSAQVRGEVTQIVQGQGKHELRPDRERPSGPAVGAANQAFLQPYTGWETARGLGDLDSCVHALHARDADAVQILILGGSEADAFDRASAGAERLSKILSAHPSFGGKNADLLRFGREGYKEPQWVNLLVYLLDLGFEPDVVITISGSDEVALGNDNAAAGVHPVFPAAAHWSNLAVWGTSDRNALDAILAVRRTQRALDQWGGMILDWGIFRSALLGQPALLYLLDLSNELEAQANAYENYLTHVSNRRSLLGPTLDGGEREAIEASVSAWQAGSRCMQGICRGRGILYLQVLPPALNDKGSKPLTARELELRRAPRSWARGIELGYPMLRESGVELSRLGLNFVDASQLFAGLTDDVYVDALCYGPAGQALLAEKIGQELLQRWPRQRSQSNR